MFTRHTALALVTGFAVVAGAGCSEASRLNLRCIGGDMQRCRQLGDMYATGTRVARDVARAAELYEKVCDAGVADVCNALGELYEQRVVPTEEASKRSEELFERSCNGGSTPGCLNFGIVQASREEFEKAAVLYDRACTGGLTAGCHYLAGAAAAGEGIPRDVARAVALYDEACGADYVDSCLSLAALYAEGTAVDADPARVTAYYGKALKIYADGCDAGIGRDCAERDRLRTRIALQSANPPPAPPKGPGAGDH